MSVHSEFCDNSLKKKNKKKIKSCFVSSFTQVIEKLKGSFREAKIHAKKLSTVELPRVKVELTEEFTSR
jgi:hypothetical protein